MQTQYQKTYYPNPFGFSLHHTAGLPAGNSTVNYPHHNADFLLIWFLKGRGSITVEGNRQEIAPGDLILLHRGELYRCTVDDGEYHERVVIHIVSPDRLPLGSEGLLQPLRSRPKGVGNRIGAEAVNQWGMDRLLTDMLHCSRARTEADDVLVMCRLLELLAVMGRSVLPDTSAQPVAGADNPRMEQVLRYIHDHLQEDISVESIAAACSIHKSHLSHLFKDYMGTSVWNYVILRRLNLFNERLRENHGVEQTCYSVGFQNYANFYRLYKKHMGITPVQYRKQLMNESQRR